MRYSPALIEIKNNKIAYLDEGSGDCILMLSASPVYSFMYEPFIDKLKQTHRCIAPDFPGTGRTKLQENQEVTYQSYATILDQFIEKLRLENITLFVHALAGPIGLEVLTKKKEKFRALVICNSFGFPIKDYPAAKPLKVLTSPFGRFLIVNLNMLPKMVTGSIKKKGVGVVRNLNSNEKKTILLPYKEKANRLVNFLLLRQAVSETDWLLKLESKLQKIDIPVLLLPGIEDNGHRDGYGERFHKIFPNCETIIIEGAGHFAPIDKPLEMIKALKKWYDKNHLQYKSIQVKF